MNSLITSRPGEFSAAGVFPLEIVAHKQQCLYPQENYQVAGLSALYIATCTLGYLNTPRMMSLDYCGIAAQEVFSIVQLSSCT